MTQIQHEQLKPCPFCGDADALKAEVERLKAQPAGVWPDFIAPPKYDNPDPRWQDPRLPDFRLIWAVARECGYSIGLHGSMRRDCDMIAAPWTDDAVLAFDLIERLCTALNAQVVGPVAGKPHGRLGWNLQVDGWVKVIDISVMPRACDRNAAPPPQPITVQDAAKTILALFVGGAIDPFDCTDLAVEALAIKHAGNRRDGVGQLEIAEEFFVAALTAIAEGRA